MQSLTLLFTLLCILHLTWGCGECDVTHLAQFVSGSQHSDCFYATSVARNSYPLHVTEEQNEIDLHWMRVCHDFALEKNPKSPFCAALVYQPTNELLSIAVNMKSLNDHQWSTFDAHAEKVAMTNCSSTVLQDTNPSGSSLVLNPKWANVTLYGNIEMCPMCASTAVYRGITRFVYGARAKELYSKRCWTQSSLTSQEVYDHSSRFFSGTGSGPLLPLEDIILNAFPSRC
jgi:tRNA(Arg) A34 adenosine deaminase TadA